MGTTTSTFCSYVEIREKEQVSCRRFRTETELKPSASVAQFDSLASGVSGVAIELVAIYIRGRLRVTSPRAAP